MRVVAGTRHFVRSVESSGTPRRVHESPLLNSRGAKGTSSSAIGGQGGRSSTNEGRYDRGHAACGRNGGLACAAARPASSLTRGSASAERRPDPADAGGREQPDEASACLSFLGVQPSGHSIPSASSRALMLAMSSTCSWVGWRRSCTDRRTSPRTLTSCHARRPPTWDAWCGRFRISTLRSTSLPNGPEWKPASHGKWSCCAGVASTSRGRGVAFHHHGRARRGDHGGSGARWF